MTNFKNTQKEFFTYKALSQRNISVRSSSRFGVKLWNEIPCSLRNLHKKEFKTEIRRLLLDILVKETRSSQSIKIGIDLLIDKSIKIGKSDLIDIDCIDQSVESMTHSLRLSIYLDFTDSIDLYRKNYTCSSVHPKMKTAFMQTVNLLTIELQLRVEGSNNLLSLFKKQL